VQTLAETHKVMREGVDVRGYFAWSLMDNYEWNQGSATKMGLYAVDPTTKARTIREAGAAYADIASTRTITPEQEQRYATFFR
jgi:beta-glucosidase